MIIQGQIYWFSPYKWINKLVWEENKVPRWRGGRVRHIKTKEKRKIFIECFFVFFCFFFNAETNKVNKLTVSLCCLDVADPATSLASKCSGDLMFLREQLVHSEMEKVNISEQCHLIKIVNINVLSLNFFPQATQCSFNIRWKKGRVR